MADMAWEEVESSWGGVSLTSKDFAPVYIQTASFYILGYDASIALNASFERVAVLHANGRPLLGRGIWPQIVGPDGGQISISLGGSNTPEGSINWEGPYTFEIGEDTFVDFAVDGKYLSVKFESTSVATWSLQSYDIDYQVIGEY